MEDSIFDASVSQPSTIGDDESGTAPAETAEQQQQRQQNGHRDFFDWLFGRDKNPPPPPPSSPQDDNSDNDNTN